jgi:hypothetical protein
MQEGEGTFSCPGPNDLSEFAMRKHKRYALELSVAVKEAAGQEGNRIFLLRTVDVSAGGALFYAERGLPAGTEVQLIFFLHTDPQEAKIDPRYKFRGTVVRSEPGRFAVAFVKEMQADGPATLSGPETEAPVIPFSVSKRPDRERT